MGTPLNGHVEVGGPERFQMDGFFRDTLAGWGDPREVGTDPHARYFGAEGPEESLVPVGDGATHGEIKYADWPGRDTPPR